MNTWNNIIVWWFTYDQVCIDYDLTSDSCSHWKYYAEKEIVDSLFDQLSRSQSESITYFAFWWLAVLILFWLIKWIFRLILPTKWRN